MNMFDYVIEVAFILWLSVYEFQLCLREVFVGHRDASSEHGRWRDGLF